MIVVRGRGALGSGVQARTILPEMMSSLMDSRTLQSKSSKE